MIFVIAFNTVNAEVKIGEYDGVTETLSLLKGQNITWIGKQPPKDRTFTVSMAKWNSKFDAN